MRSDSVRDLLPAVCRKKDCAAATPLASNPTTSAPEYPKEFYTCESSPATVQLLDSFLQETGSTSPTSELASRGVHTKTGCGEFFGLH
eukprot:7736690-Pyramimonas_sp.AAC.1